MRANLTLYPLWPECSWRRLCARAAASCAVCLASALFVSPAAADPPAGKAPGDSRGLMYWTHRGEGIYRAALDGSAVTLLVEKKYLDGLAVDAEGGKLYFTTSTGRQGADKLLGANLDGTQVTELATGLNYTGDVVFDPKSKKLYISSLAGRKILQCNPDGAEMSDFATGLISPDELAMDVAGRWLYWSASGRGGPIQRAKLDSRSDPEDIVPAPARRLGIAVDSIDRQIYWVDADSDGIRRAGLDGKGETQIVGGRIGLDGLALDEGDRKIYWTETGMICRANLDGSGIEIVVPDKTRQYASLVVLPSKKAPAAPGD